MSRRMPPPPGPMGPPFHRGDRPAFPVSGMIGRKMTPPGCTPQVMPGLDPKHFGKGIIIDILTDNDGISQNDLAKQLNIRPQSMSEALNKLCEDGIVEKRPNENDKRGSLVYLTEEGRRIASGMVKGRLRFAKEFFEPLSEEEQLQLYGLLEKLVNAKSGSEMKKEGNIL
jgi:DNA-binding MarR family transcriptional regulator